MSVFSRAESNCSVELRVDSVRRYREPTLRPFPDFNPQADARTLTKALSAGSHDEAAVINLLAKRSHCQREEIITAYNTSGRDLSQDLSTVFSSKCLKVLLALLEPPDEFLAKELERALNRLGTDGEVISEILCTRSNAKIAGIQLAYHKLYGKTLLSVISSEFNLSADYKELMSMLLQGLRSEVRGTNQEKAKRRALSVHNAVEEGWSTSTKIFLRLLTHESIDQLCVIFDEYRLVSGLAMEQAVKSAFSGDAEVATLAIVKAAINKNQYYAEVLEAALRKFRRDDGTLIRIFVTRAEVDLESIKMEYLKIYHKTLYHSIQTETSGVYRDIMLALLNTP